MDFCWWRECYVKLTILSSVGVSMHIRCNNIHIMAPTNILDYLLAALTKQDACSYKCTMLLNVTQKINHA